MQKKVLILLGSDSDLPVMEEAVKTLKEFDIPYELTVASAHRSPKRVQKLAEEAEKNGFSVIIAAAGMSAHLAGVVAAHTILPVIGVPMSGSQLNGLDALLSMVQMPSGVPVATVAIGKAGAKNSAILAAEILSVGDKELRKKLHSYKDRLAEEVEKKAKSISS